MVRLFNYVQTEQEMNQKNQFTIIQLPLIIKLAFQMLEGSVF